MIYCHCIDIDDDDIDAYIHNTYAGILIPICAEATEKARRNLIAKSVREKGSKLHSGEFCCESKLLEAITIRMKLHNAAVIEVQAKRSRFCQFLHTLWDALEVRNGPTADYMISQSLRSPLWGRTF